MEQFALQMQLKAKLAQVDGVTDRFELLGADRQAQREVRIVHWEQKLQELAQVLGTNLDALPRRKSAPEKVLLAAAMKATSSVSNGWLAQRLRMGATTSISPLLYRFRQHGGAEQPAFRATLSRLST